MFQEKFSFQELQHRTAMMTNSFDRIYLINKELKGEKKGQKIVKNLLSHKGWKDMLLSSEFLYDLGLLARLKQKMMELDPQLSNRIEMK